VNARHVKRVVLAYSGGLVTSAALGWLARELEAEVVTVTLDFGEERELAAVRERALALGAVRAHVVDAREELVREYMIPALQAGVLMDGHALTRPLVARRLVDIARMEMAPIVAHGGEPGSQGEAALHAAVRSLNPALEVIAPARDWRLPHADLVALARAGGGHVPAAPRYRVEASLWGRVLTAEPGQVIPDDAFTLTRSPEACPEQPAMVDIEFAAGVPVRANGVEMPMIELIESLETIAGAHGVGRSRTGGTVVEAPAAIVLDAAHRDLVAFVVGPDFARLKDQLSHVYAAALASGRWFSDLREAIDAFGRVIQPRVTGTVRLKLLKGQCMVISRESAGGDGRPAPPSRHSEVTA